MLIDIPKDVIGFKCFNKFLTAGYDYYKIEENLKEAWDAMSRGKDHITAADAYAAHVRHSARH